MSISPGVEVPSGVIAPNGVFIPPYFWKQINVIVK